MLSKCWVRVRSVMSPPYIDTYMGICGRRMGGGLITTPHTGGETFVFKKHAVYEKKKGNGLSPHVLCGRERDGCTGSYALYWQEKAKVSKPRPHIGGLRKKVSGRPLHKGGRRNGDSQLATCGLENAVSVCHTWQTIGHAIIYGLDPIFEVVIDHLILELL